MNRRPRSSRIATQASQTQVSASDSSGDDDDNASEENTSDIAVTSGKRRQPDEFSQPKPKRLRRQGRRGNASQSDSENDNGNDIGNDIASDSNDENENNNNNRNNSGRNNQKNKKKKEKAWCSNTQTAHERMNIRVGYRDLADETERRRADIVDPTNNAFKDVMDKQDSLYEKVQETTEAHMDIEQSVRMSLLLKDETTKLANQNFTISLDNLIDSVINNFSLNDENNKRDVKAHGAMIDWKKLGKNSLYDYINTCPTFCKSIHIGNLQKYNKDFEKKENEKEKLLEISKKELAKERAMVRKERKERWKTQCEQKSAKVITMDDAKKLDKTETKSRIQSLKRLLKKQSNVGFYSFLINPNSYSQTIENIFDLSFMAKEGNAMITPNNSNSNSNNNNNDNNNEPVIRYLSKEAIEREKAKQVNNGQCIIKMDYNQFLTCIDFYNINESQISRPQNMNSNNENEKDKTKQLFNNFDESDSENENIVDRDATSRSGSGSQSKIDDSNNSNDDNDNDNDNDSNNNNNNNDNNNDNENENKSKSKSKAERENGKRKGKDKNKGKEKSKKHGKKGKREIDESDSETETETESE